MNATQSHGRKIIALSGGVGGAKLAVGLARQIKGADLTIIVNVGDDFEHVGLNICPDLDSVMYALAGVTNPETGWGRAEESWSCLTALKELGHDAWFQLGDKDLAVHIERTRCLREHMELSEITARLCRAFGVETRVCPVSDDPVRTAVMTNEGLLSFQNYLVRRRSEPSVSGFVYRGSDNARISRTAAEALADEELGGIILCPSNPFVSIDPILSVPGVRKALNSARVPIVAVSPIIGGKAVKGPVAKMFKELGMSPTSYAVARHYRGVIDAIVIDNRDAAETKAIEELGIQVMATDILMSGVDDKTRLAGDVLAFARTLPLPDLAAAG